MFEQRRGGQRQRHHLALHRVLPFLLSCPGHAGRSQVDGNGVWSTGDAGRSWGRDFPCALEEGQARIFDGILEQHLLVAAVVHEDEPRVGLALAREKLLVALDVAGLHRVHDPVVQCVAGIVAGSHDIEVVLVHVVEKPAQVFGRQADLEGPGNVGVAEYPGHVRQVFQEHALVGHLLADRIGGAVHRHDHPAQYLEPEPGRRDDDVGRQVLAGLEHNAAFAEALDVIGFDRGAATTDGFEQVAIGHRAQALVPRHVVGGEVAHVGVGADLATDVRKDDPAHQPRPLPAGDIGRPIQHDIALAGQAIGPAGGHDARERGRQCVGGRQRVDIRRGALQHGDMPGFVGHGRYQRGRGGTAADHHDVLAGVVQVLRPVLRMDPHPFERLLAGKARQETCVVVVVAGAAQQELAAVLPHRCAGLMHGADLPQALLAAPVGAGDLHAVMDLLVQAMLPGRVLDVPPDRGAVGEHLGASPQAELVAVAEHVRIGTDAWVTEQVPGAAHAGAPLEDRHAALRELLRQLAGGTNA
ncbi:hypothetical protein WR25_15956 [Diploscapter pachys]|uniref:UspA domain-containing protein n=1 Tax=Diploscapter pachys TaxID=2018661 RepID=A0A2A2KEW9_9BILA|nr:hypothetical protein WR25_15956 [Diploscapter pachys]